jgi:hypothetical protein
MSVLHRIRDVRYLVQRRHTVVCFSITNVHVTPVGTTVYLILLLVLINARRMFYFTSLNYTGGTRWRSWLRHCATNRKVAGSIPDEDTRMFQ